MTPKVAQPERNRKTNSHWNLPMRNLNLQKCVHMRLSLSYVDEYCKVVIYCQQYSSTLNGLIIVFSSDFLALGYQCDIAQTQLHNHQHQESRYSLYIHLAYRLYEWRSQLVLSALWCLLGHW